MNTEILLAIIAIIGSIATAVVTHLFERGKYEVEIDKLRAELHQAEAKKNGTNLENTQKLIDIIMKQVAEPVEQEAKKLRYAVNRFTKAIEQIPTCEYHANCPVTRELQKSPASLDERDRDKNGNT